MKKLLLILLLLSALPGRAQPGPPTLPGRFVVKLRPPAAASLAALRPALAALGSPDEPSQKFPRSQPPSGEQPGSVDLRLVYELRQPAGTSSTGWTLAKLRARLLATGAVEYVEPLYVREPQYLPNDPRADSTLASGGQYHLRLTQAYRAWDFTRGDTSVVIGITETGLRYSHEDLVRQVKYNYADPINGLDDDGDGYVDNFRGWDFANNTNDPLYETRTTHGSMVAGLAAGQADNGRGIAGVGFSCKFLPLQVFPAAGSAGSFAGYEAIVYAADHGCRVINLSWGAAGGYSRFEQDVCTYAAVNRDAVLVAAAGNTPANVLFYPASYDHVLSVAASDAADVKAGFSTFNNRVDLFAPGVNIVSSAGWDVASSAGPLNADYYSGSGTSFAAPQVAGAAALVRARFPRLLAEQVRALLRRSADPAPLALPANAPFAALLGAGRLHVARAVATQDRREARVVESTFAPTLSAGFGPGASPRLIIKVRNELLALSNLRVTLSSLSPLLSVTAGDFVAGSLGTLGEATNAGAPFALAVAGAGVPPNTTATLRFRLTADGGYQTDQFLDVLLNPDFVQLDAGDLSLSVFSAGNLAYADPSGSLGQGLSFRGSTPLLSEAGLLLATSPTRVSDRLRTQNGAARQSFFSLAQVRRLVPGPRADQQARAAFRDSLPDPARPRSVGVRVRQRGQSWGAPADRRGMVLLDYVLTNLTADTLKPLYAGVFADWDLPGESTRNVARYDSVRRVGYCFDPRAPRFYAGVQALGPRPAGVYCLDNNAPPTDSVCLSNGFSSAEKYLTLRAGFGRRHRAAGTDATGADVSVVMSQLIPRLAPGDSATVVFAVLAAPDLPGLQAAAQAATTAHQQVLAVAPAAASAPDWQLFPNPTTGQFRLSLPARFGPVRAQVLDARGRLVADTALSAGGGELNMSALSPGLYLVRLPALGWARRVARQ